MNDYQSGEQLVFVISNEQWGKQWFIKHHYANELSSLGYEVYFINPVSSWSLFDLWDRKLYLEKINENLTVVSYKNFLPVRIFPRLITKINDYVVSRTLSSQIQKNRNVIVWQFDPFRFSYNFFQNAFKLYHISDHYSDLPLDRQNVESSDLMVCTGASLIDYYRGFNKPVIHIPHGISSQEYKVNESEVGRIKERYGEFIFHAGSINDRLDLDLISNIPDRFPRYQVVFVGPVILNNEQNRVIWKKCLAKPNFNFLGTIESNAIKNYAQASKVCLLCYSFDSSQRIGTVSSSLKVLHYLAQKKAIVSSIKLEYNELIDRLIFCADNKRGYFELMEGILNGDIDPDLSVIDSFLSSSSYPRLLDKIFQHIS